MRRQLLTNLVILVTAFLVMLPGMARAEDPVPQTIATIEVIGRAAISVKPDVALIAFTVETNARQASEAVSGNAQKTQTLLDALRKIMGPEDKLQSTSFNLQPVFAKDDRLRPSGYRVGNRVTVETILLEKIGDFIDAAAASGRLRSATFSSARPARRSIDRKRPFWPSSRPGPMRRSCPTPRS